MSVIAELVAKLSVDGVSEAGRDLGGFSSKLEDLSGKARSWGAGLSVGVTAPLVFMGNQAAEMASSISESMNKVAVVFGKSGDEVIAFSETTASAMGISQAAALETAGTFGNIFNASGVAQDAAADMSQNLVGLAADLASFNNEDPTVVLDKLRAGLVGEAEPLRALGVLLSEDAVKTKALAMGLAESAKELTAADKVQARYAIILEQTAVAQGDFARTAEGAANSARIATARYADMQAMIGKKVLPIKMKLLGVVGKLIGFFSNLSPAQQDLIVKVGMLAAAIGPLLAGLGMIVPALGAIGAVLGVVLSPVGLLIAGVAALGVVIVKNFDRIRQVVKPVGELFSRFSDSIATAFKNGGLAGAASAVAKSAGDLWNGLLSWWDSNGSVWVSDAWGRVVTWLKSTVANVGTAAANLWNSLLTWWNTDGAAWASSAWGKAKEKLGATVVSLATSAANLWNSLLDWWDTDGKAWATDAIKRIGKALNALPADISEFAKKTWSQLADWWATSESAEMLRRAALQMWAGLDKAFTETIPSINFTFGEALGERLGQAISSGAVYESLKAAFKTALTTAFGAAIGAIITGEKGADAGRKSGGAFFDGFFTGLSETWDSPFAKFALAFGRKFSEMFLSGGPIIFLVRTALSNFISAVMAVLGEEISKVTGGLFGGGDSGGGTNGGGGFAPAFNLPGMGGGGADYVQQGRTAGQQWAAAYAQAVQEHISGMGEAIAASLQPPVDYRYRRATVGVRALP